MLNKVLLIGRVTKKPIINTFSNDTKISTFSIAINKGYSRNSGTDFVSCKAFNKTAETLSQYVDKGSLILVEGKISTSSYVNKENKRIFAQDIIVSTVTFLDSKKDSKERVKTSEEGNSEIYNSFKNSFLSDDKKANNEEEDFKFSEDNPEDIDWEV